MRRAREDLALEVLVGEQLVGWLTEVANVPFHQSSLTVRHTIVDNVFGDLGEQRTFQLLTFHMEVAGVDAAREGLFTWVPYYAQHRPVPNKDATMCSWRVLQLTPDEYDWVFDLESFVPADTDIDADHLLELSPEERLGELIGKQIQQDIDRSLLQLTGGFTNAATAANDSTLTVEKLQVAMRQFKF